MVPPLHRHRKLANRNDKFVLAKGISNESIQTDVFVRLGHETDMHPSTFGVFWPLHSMGRPIWSILVFFLSKFNIAFHIENLKYYIVLRIHSIYKLYLILC